MKRLQIVSLVFVVLFLLLLASLVMWFHMIRQATRQSHPRVPGAFSSLAEFEFSRNYGQNEEHPGGFYYGFEHAQNMEPFWPEKSKTPPWWRPIGPMNWGGRTLALAIDAQNPNRIFAGAASGGLWVSHTSGRGDQAWEYIDTGYPVLGVASIALDPSDSNTMLIGTGEVYSHATGMPSIGERILRGSFGIGILKSTDGGETWVPSLDWRYQNQTGVQAIEFDPLNPDRVWAATTEGIYRSDDRGDSWTQVLAVVMGTDIVVHPEQTDSVLVSCGGMHSPNNGIYRTQDGGNHWTRMTSGPSGSIGGKAMLGASPSHPNVVYATIGRHPYDGQAHDVLLRSNNFGSTWATVSEESFARHQGFYSHFVGVHPQNPDRIIVGGVEMWDSTQGGRNLELAQIHVIDNEIVDTMTLIDSAWVDTFGDNHTMEFHPTDPDIFYVGCDQGVFRTDDLGHTYERCVGGYQTAQFYDGMAQDQTTPNRLWGSIQDWAGFAFTGTTSWVVDDTIFEGGKVLIDPFDPEVRYASYYYVDWVHRIDHGNLTDISPPQSGTGSFAAPFALAPSNPSVLYAGRDVVFKSENRGDTWHITNNGFPICRDPYNPTLSMAVAHDDENRVYVSTAPYVSVTPPSNRARVFRTSNGGVFWTEITGNLPNRFVTDMKVDPADRDRLFLTLGGFGTSHVFFSQEAGESWENLDGGELPDVPTWAILLDPHRSNSLYIGNDLGVFASFDNGQSWTHINRGMPPAVMVMDLVVHEEERLLRAGTHGNGVFELSLPAFFDDPVGTELTDPFEILGVFSP